MQHDDYSSDGDYTVKPIKKITPAAALKYTIPKRYTTSLPMYSKIIWLLSLKSMKTNELMDYILNADNHQSLEARTRSVMQIAQELLRLENDAIIVLQKLNRYDTLYTLNLSRFN